MPLITGSLALSGAAQQLTTTKTQVVALYISNSTATAYVIGNSSSVAATGPGILVPSGSATTPQSISGPQGTFNLTEIYVIGASGTLNYLGVTR
jgi:hypothetical protein